MPNVKGQLIAKELGMFIAYKTKKVILKDQPFMLKDLKKNSEVAVKSDKRFFIRDKIKEKVFLSNVVVPKSSKIEISHHYGIDKFFNTGAVLFHIINKEYSKILVMMFKNQSYPAHYHNKKTETYLILEGDLEIKIKNKLVKLKTGDVYTIKKNTVHSFRTKKGVIFEEIATKYIKGDSKYIDKNIHKNRKTRISIFN